jgi:hypothetical protein
MQDGQLLDIDLSASLWVLGVFAMSMLALHFAERLAHTRARNRTRLAIDETRNNMQDNAENATNSRAME